MVTSFLDNKVQDPKPKLANSKLLNSKTYRFFKLPLTASRRLESRFGILQMWTGFDTWILTVEKGFGVQGVKSTWHKYADFSFFCSCRDF